MNLKTARMRRGLVWPAIGVGVAALALLIGAQVYAARASDAAARLRDAAIVENGLAARVQEITAAATGVTIWDEAVEKLDNAFDPAWAEANIGSYLAAAEGFESTLVLDASDMTLYAMRDGETVDAWTTRDVAAAAAPVIAHVRADEAARGPAADILAREGAISAPVSAAMITRIGEAPFVISATLVQPDFGAYIPRQAQSVIIVTADAIDAAFLDIIASRFLLRDAALHPADQVLADGAARALMRDLNGQPVIALDWTPPQPGSALLVRVLPPMVAIVILLCIIAAVLYGRGRRAAENLIASEARASHMAYHDTLTGLPNRALLGDRLQRALGDNRRARQVFAVHMIDLDRFKDINDTYGHEAGDDVIRHAARVLSSACRESDTLARLGGDEFAIIQTHATPQSAGVLADRIVRLMGEPIDLPVGRLYIGASVGVTIINASEGDGQEYLRQADLALYRAKEQGRNRFAFFDADMDASVRARRVLQNDLREAVAAGALQLHYQPQVDGLGRMCGVEALVRWTHPERGAVPPGVFVPVAEESGLIDALGMFTLRRAFEDCVRWPSLSVAVNVSASQVRRKDFVAQIAALVAETAVTPAHFELEITEGLLLGDDIVTHDNLQKLRAMGFHIALDDFGTGYSSLSYLQRYPIDKIKIDRSFIVNLGVRDEAEAVVHAIVRLARALGLAVIAEGVETELQRERLIAAGCDHVQGYLFGKPCPADEIARRLDGSSPTAEAA